MEEAGETVRSRGARDPRRRPGPSAARLPAPCAGAISVGRLKQDSLSPSLSPGGGADGGPGHSGGWGTRPHWALRGDSVPCSFHSLGYLCIQKEEMV